MVEYDVIIDLFTERLSVVGSSNFPPNAIGEAQQDQKIDMYIMSFLRPLSYLCRRSWHLPPPPGHVLLLSGPRLYSLASSLANSSTRAARAAHERLQLKLLAIKSAFQQVQLELLASEACERVHLELLASEAKIWVST